MTDTSKEAVERLRAFAQGCRGSMWQSRDETIKLMDEAADTLRALAAENEGLREALAFYADKKNWNDGRLVANIPEKAIDVVNSSIEDDQGKRARAALQAHTPQDRD